MGVFSTEFIPSEAEGLELTPLRAGTSATT